VTDTHTQSRLSGL